MRLRNRCPGRLARLLAVLLALIVLRSPLAGQMTGVVVISEIMYHPLGGGQDLEYIELYNASSSPVDLSNWFFSRGVFFTFPAGTWLDSDQYLVVCSDRARVQEVYDIQNVIGDWLSCGDRGGPCALDNGGEAIELSERAGVVAARVRYNDRGRWSAAPDGTGHSLELISVFSDHGLPENWAASGSLGGSPGKANETELRALPVFINEGLLLTAGEPWIELYNAGNEEVDLSGFFVTDDRGALGKARLPAGTTISPREWRVLTAVDLGLDFTPMAAGPESPARTFVALSEPAEDGTPLRVIDAVSFEPEVEEMAEARIPDGGSTWSARAVPTSGSANRVDVPDSIVINEIMYHPIDLNPDAEFLELYNRGDAPVDLSGWRLTSGVNFEFPQGTVMAPDSYLVVARSPSTIREVHGLAAGAVLGPNPADEDAVDRFGRLRDDGERVILRDVAGNIADAIRYHDGGQWPTWADGGGSSLELIDPFQNNDVGSAWDASDDSEKSESQEFLYEGRFVTGQPEFHLALNHRGITVVDDLGLFQRAIQFEARQTLIAVGDEWRYFKGTEAPSDPPEAWRQPEFDDAGWLLGATPIGYGEQDEMTVLDDMRRRQADGVEGYLTFFARKEFQIVDLAALETLVFEIQFDDGYAAYLNGERISTNNLRTGQDTFDARARSSRENARDEVDLTEFAHLFVEGRNVLAIQVHNSTPTSTDARCIPQLRSGVFVVEDGPNQIMNGDFEEPLTRGLRPGGWLLEGTHVRSGRTLVEPISGKASLKIVASAKGDNKVNRLEQTLPSLRQRSTYVVSLKARWIIGSPSFLTHGHNQASASFDYAKSHRLNVPRNLGTPGAPNSVTLRQIAETGSFNIGPVISRVHHTPSVPAASQDVEVTARVEDPDGVQDVRLRYWTEDTRGRPGPDALEEIAMAGPDPDGHYTATVPQQSLRVRVIYFIVATDGGGREGRFPLDVPSRTHPLLLDRAEPDIRDLSFVIYRHDVPARPRNRLWQSYRFYTKHSNELHMQRQRLLSNDRQEGTFIFEDRDVYYNARVRFTGSPWARSRFSGSYRVYMPKDKSLHGSPHLKRFNMEDHQRGSLSVLERLSHYLIRHNQGNIRVPYSFPWLVQWQMNDKINTGREHFQAPNRQFVEYWFPDDDDGDMFEMDDRFEINDGGSRQSSIDARWTYPPMRAGVPDDKENYRWFFNVRLKKGLDDYSRLIETAKVLDRRTPDVEFDKLVWEHINVEQMLRVWAIRMNTDDWDTWGTDRGKNCYLYRSPTSGLWNLFAWDMELTYNDVGRFMPRAINQPYNSINTGKFPEVFRMINRPRIKRLYYGIMAEMIDKQFNSEFLAPFSQRVSRLSMINTDRMRRGGFIDQRANRLRGILRSAVFPAVQLEITTGGGDPIQTDQTVVTIEGRAPVDIFNVILFNDSTPNIPASVTFSNDDHFVWSAQVALTPGNNDITAVGVDTAGEVVDTASAQVVAMPPLPTLDSVVPGRMSVGDIVRVNGTNLHPGLKVFFGDVAAEDIVFDDLPASFSVAVPRGVPAGQVPLMLESPDGTRTDPFMVEVEGSAPIFVRGDADRDGAVSLPDVLNILFFLFRSGSVGCLDAADADDNGAVNLTDAIYVLNYKFLRGPAPTAPFPDLGVDPTDDALGCERQ
ncbi:MAG: lamin tail domain-containing protein [Planctomycetota bacterium]|nr:lamin tail domain-containing protein [Planctomycetota bacterium]